MAVTAPRGVQLTLGAHLAAGIVLCVALTLPHLDADLYGDELGHTLRYLGGTRLSAIFTDLTLVHPPLFFLLARAAFALLGEPWAMRVPSLLFAAATIPAFAWCARRVLGERFVVPAVYAAALSPFLLEFAGEGRAYATTIFFSAASTGAFHAFLERETPRRAAALWLTLVAGALSHFIFLLHAAFLALWYLGCRRRTTLLALGVAVGAVLVVGPFVALQSQSGAAGASRMLQGGWAVESLRHANLLGRLGVALAYGYNLFLLGPLDPARNVGLSTLRDNAAAATGVALVAVGCVAGIVRSARERAPVWFLLAGVAVPVALALAGAAAGWYLPREKHLATAWVFAQQLLLLAMVRLWDRPLGRAVVACHVLLVALALFNGTVSADTYSRRSNWSGLARSLATAAASGDAAVSYLFPLDWANYPERALAARGVAERILKDEAGGGTSLAGAAAKLDAEVRGTIFLVYDETQRNLLDPGDVVIRELRARRGVTSRGFGRNLKLISFAPRRPECVR